MEGKLFIIHGMGNDSVGLVGEITTPLARAKGNILDLRQDVIHGLFSINIVLDLSGSRLQFVDLREMLKDISENTGLTMSVDRYIPVPRSSRIRNVLLVLLGRDRPGIIATVAEKLSSYNINIELSEMIARGDVFLMDLMIDIRNSSIPIENIQKQLSETMKGIGIHTMFQAENVFNKKKKIILFDISRSFMTGKTVREIIDNTDITLEELKDLYVSDDIDGSMKRAARRLEGYPVDAVAGITCSVEIAPGTVELVQTLKMMGYRIGLMTSGFSLFSDAVRELAGIDYSYGYNLLIDSDSKTFTGDIDESYAFTRREQSHQYIMETESVKEEDIAILDDIGMEDTPGFQLLLNPTIILDYYNKNIITRETLPGILGCFGFPRL